MVRQKWRRCRFKSGINIAMLMSMTICTVGDCWWMMLESRPLSIYSRRAYCKERNVCWNPPSPQGCSEKEICKNGHETAGFFCTSMQKVSQNAAWPFPFNMIKKCSERIMILYHWGSHCICAESTERGIEKLFPEMILKALWMYVTAQRSNFKGTFL
jgi:hypothetical protein